MKTEQPGFVLLSVFLLLTMATVFVTQLYYRGSIYNTFIPVAVEREKAKQLAQMGIAVAINQLALYDEKLVPENDGGKQSKTGSDEKDARNLLKILLTVQNRWQVFEFDQEKDGLEGVLKICITCDDGKIPLGGLIDYQKAAFKNNEEKKFKGEKFFENLFDRIKSFIKNYDLLETLQSYIKQQKYELFEVTDLLNYKEFKLFRDAVFYKPTEQKSEQKQKLYLADLFSDAKSMTLHPALLSPSVRVAYGLNPEGVTVPLDEESVEKLVTQMSVKEADWKKEWDTFLQPIYKKEYKSLPGELTALFGSKFEPTHFSVVCYGKVGTIGQTLLATVERTFTQQGEQFEVRKIYWL